MGYAAPIFQVSASLAYWYGYDTTGMGGGGAGLQVYLKTTDSGAHWSKMNVRAGSVVWAFLSEHNFIGYGKKTTILARSTDEGASFTPFNDPSEIEKFTVDGKVYDNTKIVITPAYSYFDSLHWIANVTEPTDTNHTIAPPGITQLLSSDGGVHWAVRNSLLPDSVSGHNPLSNGSVGMEYSGAHGGPGRGIRQKSIPNTSWLFGITGSEWSAQEYARSVGGQPSSILSYYYTPDYGQTWHFGCDFPYRVRGFEAVDTNEIWMTVLPKRNEYYEWANTKVFTTNYDASWIVHSTDLGKTWEIDSTTLDGRPYDQSFYDGAIVSSSDPAHVWIAAEYNYHTYIFRYNKNEQKSGVEEYVPLNYPNFVNIYPNPAQTHTTITLARGCPITNVTLVDIMGRDVTAPLTRLKEHSVDLDISKLQSGIYIAGIRTPYGPYAKLVSVVK